MVIPFNLLPVVATQRNLLRKHQSQVEAQRKQTLLQINELEKAHRHREAGQLRVALERPKELHLPVHHEIISPVWDDGPPWGWPTEPTTEPEWVLPSPEAQLAGVLYGNRPGQQFPKTKPLRQIGEGNALGY